jgi:hypothetical protein
MENFLPVSKRNGLEVFGVIRTGNPEIFIGNVLLVIKKGPNLRSAPFSLLFQKLSIRCCKIEVFL